MDNEATMMLPPEPPVYNGPAKPAEAKGQPAGKKSSGTAAAVGIAAGAGVAGIALGAAAGAFASDNIEVEGADQEANGVSHNSTDGDVKFADVDANSFDKAFAEARAELGPGGAFEYNGKLYSTYYAEEWDAMSPEERAEHSRQIIAQATGHESYASAAADNHALASDDVLVAPFEDQTPDASDSPHKVNVQVVLNGQGDPHGEISAMLSDDPQAVGGGDNDIHVIGVQVVDNVAPGEVNVGVYNYVDDHAVRVDVAYNGEIAVDPISGEVGLGDDHEGVIAASDVELQLGGDEIIPAVDVDAAPDDSNLIFASNDLADAGGDLYEADWNPDGDLYAASYDDMPGCCDDIDPMMGGDFDPMAGDIDPMIMC